MRRCSRFLVVLVVFVEWNCAPEQTRNEGPTCDIYISRVKGMVHKHFASQISCTGNIVNNPEFEVVGTLPPGLSVDGNTGIIQGTPTVAGFWRVTLHVRDRNTGTHDQKDFPNEKRWYYSRVELAMYDKLED